MNLELHYQLYAGLHTEINVVPIIEMLNAVYKKETSRLVIFLKTFLFKLSKLIKSFIFYLEGAIKE